MKMRIVKHVAFVTCMAIAWMYLSCQFSGILTAVAVVLGSAHLGAVTLRTWPHN